MLETYKATLQDNKVDWQGESPKSSSSAVYVFITILSEEPPRRETNGKKVAEALAKIALLNNGITAIENPSEWQREQRRDR